MAANSNVSDVILPKFKLIEAFMVGLVICENKEDPFKMNALEWSQRFPHYNYGDFFRRSGAANSYVSGQILPNFELIQDVMVFPCYLQE